MPGSKSEQMPDLANRVRKSNKLANDE